MTNNNHAEPPWLQTSPVIPEAVRWPQCAWVRVWLAKKQVSLSELVSAHGVYYDKDTPKKRKKEKTEYLNSLHLEQSLSYLSIRWWLYSLQLLNSTDKKHKKELNNDPCWSSQKLQRLWPKQQACPADTGGTEDHVRHCLSLVQDSVLSQSLQVVQPKWYNSSPRLSFFGYGEHLWAVDTSNATVTEVQMECTVGHTVFMQWPEKQTLQMRI